jgi:hypothetical protein
MIDDLGGGDISGFLRHHLLMRHERVKKSDVFPLFKKDVAKLGADKSLRELSDMGELYAEFLQPSADDPVLAEVLTNLQGTSVDTHRVALMPARKFETKARFVQFAKVAEILSFRWMVIGGNAQELESIYQEAASTIYASEGAEIDAAEEYLISKFPSDDRFRDAFADESLGYPYVAAYALRKIEAAIAPGEKAVRSPSQVHVEHIMPKRVTPFWKGRIKSDEAYEEVVQRWGNLTLLLKKLNESISNGDWDTKRYGKPAAAEGKSALPGYNGSDIRMTKDLVSLSDWSSADIDLRAKWLALVATPVWSLSPDFTGIPSFLDVYADPSFLEARGTRSATRHHRGSDLPSP